MKSRIVILLCVASGSVTIGQGLITTIAGDGFCGRSGDNGPAIQAELCSPQVASADSFGNLYFADAANFVIRRISNSGIITTVAGTGVRGTTGDGGPALSATIGIVSQVSVDPVTGFVCFGDLDASKIRCVQPQTGMIQGFGTGSPVNAGDGGSFANASFN